MKRPAVHDHLREAWPTTRRRVLGAGITLAAGASLSASGLGARPSGGDALPEQHSFYQPESGRHITRIPDIRWPDGVRCVVNVTVDYDAQLARWALDEPRLELTEGEFGGRVGIWRVLDVCSRHDIRPTLFTPGRIADLYPASLREAAGRGFELADHYWEHRRPTGRQQQREHIQLTAQAMQSISGKPTLGHRGAYSTVDLVDAGFLYESLSQADDVPYFVTEEGRTIVALPTSAALNDAMYWKFGWLGSEPAGARIADAESVGDAWLDAFHEVHRRGGYMNLVLHELLTGRASRMVMLDKVFGEMRRAGGVWFASCAETARYCLDTYGPAKSD
jgi:peptidoglycan/xylan/chitin deacetylase (PgdA/CDA1 family)